MSVLTPAQIETFHRDGVVMVEDAVTHAQLSALRGQVDAWVAESRAQIADYGETLDGRARFDLEPGHSATHPALRRVQSPEEISTAFLEVMRSARTVEMVADLIGPALRFHHGKLNTKLPGSGTKVAFHQDFAFQPMSNDDMVTALLNLDAVTEANGPLEVLPGSHTGPLHSHFQGERFTGAVEDSVIAPQRQAVRRCTGPAGAVCLMHARLLHGSAPNRSTSPRTLYIATYYAEDAIELSPNHVPSRFTHELVRGEASGRVRCSAYEMAIPEKPRSTSFFHQQAAARG